VTDLPFGRLEPVHNLEIRFFLTMITVILMIIGLMAIQKNHGNHVNHYNLGQKIKLKKIMNRFSERNTPLKINTP